jgi:hypothetical protein
VRAGITVHLGSEHSIAGTRGVESRRARSLGSLERFLKDRRHAHLAVGIIHRRTSDSRARPLRQAQARKRTTIQPRARDRCGSAG